MMMTLPGSGGASASAAPALGASALSVLGASAFGISAAAACSGARLGASAFADPCEGSWTTSSTAFPTDSSTGSWAEAATGSLCASDEGETAGTALREMGSPLVSSGFCSFTVKSPIKVDHLVTFIACQFVTGPPAYGNFRKSSGPGFKTGRHLSPSTGACGKQETAATRRLCHRSRTAALPRLAATIHAERPAEVLDKGRAACRVHATVQCLKKLIRFRVLSRKPVAMIGTSLCADGRAPKPSRFPIRLIPTASSNALGIGGTGQCCLLEAK